MLSNIYELGNGYVISFYTSQGMWLLIHAGIIVNPYWWKGIQLNALYVYQQGKFPV